MSNTRNLVNRTPEMRALYNAHQDATDEIPTDDKQVLAEYTHWKLVTNRFPYDAIFSTHHMLVSNRMFTGLEDSNPEEFAEYQEIKHRLATDGFYDGILENFPKARSKPQHCHIHLFVWKYYDEVPAKT